MQQWQVCARSGLLIPLACGAANLALEVRLPAHTLPLPAAVTAAKDGLRGAPSLAMMWRAAVLAQAGGWATAYLPAAALRVDADAAQTAAVLARSLTVDG